MAKLILSDIEPDDESFFGDYLSTILPTPTFTSALSPTGALSAATTAPYTSPDAGGSDVFGEWSPEVTTSAPQQTGALAAVNQMAAPDPTASVLNASAATPMSGGTGYNYDTYRTNLVSQLGGESPTSNAIASGLSSQGVAKLEDIGVRTVMEQRHYPAIDDVSAERNEEVPVTQFYNKATGQTINGERVGIIQNGTYGVDGGDVFYNLRTDANGNPTIETKFSPRAGGFIWENPVGQLALTAAKFFPATAPFAFALDAAHSLGNEQYLNAALSAIGGANSVLNSGAFMPDSVASDAMSATIGGVPADVFAGNLQGTLGQVSTGLQLGKAIDDKQWGNVISLGTGLTGAGNMPIGNTGFTTGDVGRFASISLMVNWGMQRSR